MNARFAPTACGVGLSVMVSAVSAQMTDVTQTFPHPPGSAIGKSLSEQIGAGHGDANLPGTSSYVIERDPYRSIRRGRQIFQRKFTDEQGLGPRVSAHSSGDISENPGLGAGLADSCAACHGRPRGAAGFGGAVATRPDSRDAPHLFGLGLQEMIADEMTRRLRQIRSRAVVEAAARSAPRTRRLRSKGVDFGRLTAFPDGRVDSSRVEGVDEDLRVKPFFAQGGTISIREFIIGAFSAEMGMEAWDPVLCAATDPVNPVLAESPAGFVFDPAIDSFERPPLCDSRTDGDQDGVVSEIDPALVDHLEFYLLNYFKPGTGQMTARARQGRALLHDIGCTSCHKPHIRVNEDRRVADVETRFNPRKGILNRLYAEAEPRIVVVDDGRATPKQLPSGEIFWVRNIYSDFKRHDLGPFFHERNHDGSVTTHFMTEPLWGVGSTAPYGHDGRSINLEEVIRRHGGEAKASRTAYAHLPHNDQRKIVEFLQALVLFPPDDTASNLNPGVPGTDNPQDPSQHGSINLGALFVNPGTPE